MQAELILVAILILLWGLEPWGYYFLCRYRRRSWRVCLIEKVTLVGLQDLMPFYSFQDKQMLLQYRFEKAKRSIICDYDKHCFDAFENQQKVTIYVDPCDPDRAFLYRMPNRVVAYLFPLISVLLCVFAFS